MEGRRDLLLLLTRRSCRRLFFVIVPDSSLLRALLMFTHSVSSLTQTRRQRNVPTFLGFCSSSSPLNRASSSFSAPESADFLSLPRLFFGLGSPSTPSSPLTCSVRFPRFAFFAAFSLSSSLSIRFTSRVHSSAFSRAIRRSSASFSACLRSSSCRAR